MKLDIFYDNHYAEEREILDFSRIEKNYDEMNQEQQLEFLFDYFKNLERMKNSTFACLKNNAETFFYSEMFLNQTVNLLLSIKPKLDKRSEEVFVYSIVVFNRIEFLDTTTTAKFNTDYQKIKKEYDALNLLRKYLITRQQLFAMREIEKPFAFAVDTVLFDLAKEEINHEYCQGFCDFCKFETVENFRINQDKLFDFEAEKNFRFIQFELESDKKFLQIVGLHRVENYSFRFYFDRLIDLTAEKCKQDICDYCKVGGVEAYSRLMEKRQYSNLN